jgi:nicotinate phosphoribosyltransferase
MLSPRSALLADLYQFTMMQSYLDRAMNDTAVFEFFVRRLPRRRGFLMAAGLQQALEFLQQLCFTDEELSWLAGCGRFSRDFTDALATLRFTGDVHAMPEGTVFFANEPVLRIVAPLPVAQLVETRLINILHFQCLIASKAARMVLAAPGRLLVDFGLRRAHEAEAGLMAARASHIAGFDGTATVLAAARWDIPIYGTMAHSYILAHDSEDEAFLHFARSHRDNVVLLIDTYDTEKAAARIVGLAPVLAREGIRIRSVRLDSGDLAGHAFRVRRILDDGGLAEVRIFASGNLDEYQLQDIAAKGAPIDGFGIGTRMDTSSDAPYLDCAYKLQEYAGVPRRKTSEGKATWPGSKQVYRRDDGAMHEDILTVDGDVQDGEPLLRPFMQGGRLLASYPDIAALRSHAAAQLARLPGHLRQLKTGPTYPVRVSPALRRLARQVDRRIENA